MSIEKYKLKLEEGIYECCGKYYIGGKIVEEVLKEYHAEKLNSPPVSDIFIADVEKLTNDKVMKTLKDTKFVTDIEKQVIQNIIDSEYMDASGEQLINWSVWSFSVTNETKKLAGALGSLVKKGLCSCDVCEGEETCALTREGYYWAKNNGLCE